MTVLCDDEIRGLSLWEDHPLICPYSDNQVQPASYDVRLGNEFKVFERDQNPVLDHADPVDITKDVIVSDKDYFLLHPGEFALGVTKEKVTIPPDLVARVEGKSTIGRRGLLIHITAGFIDPGFQGRITLELYGVHPLPQLLRPGMLIAQISFQRMSATPTNPYSGRYQNATGVEAAKSRM